MSTQQRETVPASKRLAAFVAKYDPAIAARLRACRGVLRKRFQTATELVYDNYQFLVIGYSPTERPSDCIVSLVVSPNGVALSFYYGAVLPDPEGVLLGSGKQNRFVRLDGPATLTVPAVENLIRAAVAQAPVPLPAVGRHRLVIRSVSAKQRPRRRSMKKTALPRR
jgi:hypothetical protein